MLEGKRNTYQMEKRYFHKDGHVVWVLLSVSLARNEDGSPRYFISQIHDITEQKRLVEELYRERSRLQIANRNLQRLAGRDALTQVMNRLAFDERLKEELSRARREGTPLSLLMVDVDHFKRFNDEHGHAEGDRALQAVARTLVSGSREHDVVARYGGEEFVVLLPATDAVGARVAAERLRRAVEEIDGLARRVTISVGCATLLADAESRRRGDPSALLAAADQALYAAKNAGRNCVRSAELQT
ncbi:MAG: hypothetical protein KatS3mg121_1341 [Gammaproteobacteria bacterium]|nr:MAG: hypothetical protein KatS3mg121_1341 [Gammaproteobacteria bacterium]